MTALDSVVEQKDAAAFSSEDVANMAAPPGVSESDLFVHVFEHGFEDWTTLK